MRAGWGCRDGDAGTGREGRMVGKREQGIGERGRGRKKKEGGMEWGKRGRGKGVGRRGKREEG